MASQLKLLATNSPERSEGELVASNFNCEGIKNTRMYTGNEINTLSTAFTFRIVQGYNYHICKGQV